LSTRASGHWRYVVAQQVMAPEVEYLTTLLKEGQPIVTTGLVLQELLQDCGPKAASRSWSDSRRACVLTPDRQDHVDAAELRNG